MSREVSACLLMLALTFTISTLICVCVCVCVCVGVCVGVCVWVYYHLLPVKMHYSCLTLLLLYMDLFFLARVPLTLLHLLGAFDTHTCIRFE